MSSATTAPKTCARGSRAANEARFQPSDVGRRPTRSRRTSGLRGSDSSPDFTRAASRRVGDRPGVGGRWDQRGSVASGAGGHRELLSAPLPVGPLILAVRRLALPAATVVDVVHRDRSVDRALASTPERRGLGATLDSLVTSQVTAVAERHAFGELGLAPFPRPEPHVVVLLRGGVNVVQLEVLGRPAVRTRAGREPLGSAFRAKFSQADRVRRHGQQVV